MFQNKEEKIQRGKKIPSVTHGSKVKDLKIQIIEVLKGEERGGGDKKIHLKK